MSVYKDHIGFYFQSIEKYKNSINLKVIEQSINTVVDFVRDIDSEPTELLNFHDKSKLLGVEAYKYDVFKKAHEALNLNDWDFTSIGSGSICRHVADAMVYTDNLVNRRFAVPEFLDKLKTADKKNLERYEMVLHELYLEDDEAKAFRDATSCFGAKYPLISFLFFIKDQNRFLPTSPDTFDAIFSEMGIGFKMSQKCSWENYCNFIAIISCVREYLSESGLCVHGVSLLDAHSAVWVMNYEKYKSWRNTTNDINTPMKPKVIKTEANGMDDLITRLDFLFALSSLNFKKYLVICARKTSLNSSLLLNDQYIPLSSYFFLKF